MSNSEKPVTSHEDKWSAFKAPYEDHANMRAMEKHERKHYAEEVAGANGFLVPRAEKMLLEGTLPDNFKNWDIKSSYMHGFTIAHLAAGKGLLPDEFGQWGLKSKTGVSVAQMAAQTGNLPADFDKWTEDVANAYFRREKKAPGGVDLNNNFDVMAGIIRCRIGIPEEFKNWGLMSPDGRDTIAHRAAEHGVLPKNFDQWGLVGNSGQTVAHIAALMYDGPNYLMPSRIEDLFLKNSEGETVLDFAKQNPACASYVAEAIAKIDAAAMAESIAHPDEQKSMSYAEAVQALRDGTLPADFNDWGKKNSDGWTLAHAAAALGKLPADFKDWGMEGAKPGITVAHIAMRYSELPASFDDWGIKDASGKTLGEVAVKHPKLGAEYRERIEASKQAQQPNIEARAPEPQAAKPSSEAQAQGGKTNQAAPIETSSTGRITGGGRFNRPPDLSKREPEPERRPIKAFIKRGM